MPSSGELRLRTLILALVALGGIWIGLVIQRSHGTPPTAVAFAAGPRPAVLPARKLVHVAGLNRPVAVTPVASVTPRVRPFTRVPTRQTPDVRVELARAEACVRASPAEDRAGPRGQPLLRGKRAAASRATRDQRRTDP